MPKPALDELVDQPAQKMDELREHGRPRQRGGERTRARGAEAKDKPTTAGSVLATVLYLRRLGTHDLLAEHGCTLPLSTVRLRTPADVIAVLTSSNPTKITPAC